MKAKTFVLSVVGMLMGISCSNAVKPGASAAPLPKPAQDVAETAGADAKSTAVLAGGCFWCVEAVFENLEGVTSVVSGYAGGSAETAQYSAVSEGRTAHAEAVQITYDPAKISFGAILQVFFSTHDPTQRDGQGPDHGRQYRSAVFYSDDTQREVAQAYIQQLDQAKVFAKPIVTTLERLDRFYPAEDYHQDFVAHHPDHPYVQAWVPAKLKKLRENYSALLKTK